MKRLLIIIILIIVNNTLYSQNLKETLQGQWVCTNILDASGNPTAGKFGEPNEYLRFSFEKKYLSITEAPFDIGLKFPIEFGPNFFDIYPQITINVPERVYTVRSLEQGKLILSTTNESGETIDYHFINQNSLPRSSAGRDQIIDNGLIIIKHLKTSERLPGANRVAQYVINNEVKNFCPSAIFNESYSTTFGGYCAINFRFPKTYQLGTISDEMIIDFDVDDSGVHNVKIVKGLTDEMNLSVVKMIEKSGKKWKVYKPDEKNINATLRFHFIFYFGVEKLRNIFRKTS